MNRNSENHAISSEIIAANTVDNRKRDIINFYEKIAENRDNWIKRNSYFHEDDYRFSQFLIPPNLRILDIGCGGGLLCEPLNRLGASVTGIDASKNNIEVAKLHSKEMNLDINYMHCSPENLNLKSEFDVILNMEVVEHVSDVNLFIKSCSKLIKKNGIMFVATINKNLKSYIFAIIGAEYILRWLPISTHDWNKFVTPEILEKILINNNFLKDETVGMKYNLFSKKWNISEDTSVNYVSTFLKN